MKHTLLKFGKHCIIPPVTESILCQREFPDAVQTAGKPWRKGILWAVCYGLWMHACMEGWSVRVCACTHMCTHTHTWVSMVGQWLWKMSISLEPNFGWYWCQVRLSGVWKISPNSKMPARIFPGGNLLQSPNRSGNQVLTYSLPNKLLNYPERKAHCTSFFHATVSITRATEKTKKQWPNWRSSWVMCGNENKAAKPHTGLMQVHDLHVFTTPVRASLKPEAWEANIFTL